MHDDDRAARRLRMQAGKGEVAAVAGDRALTLVPRIVPLMRTDQMHFGANHRAIHKIKGQQVNAGVIAARFQVGADKGAGKVTAAVRLKIHYRKCCFVHQIYPTQSGIEFDAIEWNGGALKAYDISQVEVAVTLAYVSVRMA